MAPEHPGDEHHGGPDSQTAAKKGPNATRASWEKFKTEKTDHAPNEKGCPPKKQINTVEYEGRWGAKKGAKLQPVRR